MTDSRDLGLLALRLGVGATLVAHGTQKLFGWFGGHGLAGTAAFFESVGFTPGRANALLAGAGEAGGGSLLALGLATPAGEPQSPGRWPWQPRCTKTTASSPSTAAWSTPLCWP